MTKAFEFPAGWHCYLLLCSNDSYYCGIASNLATRIRDHFSGKGSGYTKKFKPVALVWYESHDDRNHAAARERQIKSWSREKKECLAQSHRELVRRADVVSLD
jgi:predicted GIY-YIG superfamily endonuclease